MCRDLIVDFANFGEGPAPTEAKIGRPGSQCGLMEYLRGHQELAWAGICTGQGIQFQSFSLYLGRWVIGSWPLFYFWGIGVGALNIIISSSAVVHSVA